MSTPAQLEANQANAQSSTGPRTPEGKATSSANATKHGFYGKHAVLLNDAERTQFESLCNSYVYALNPTNIVEVALLDFLVLAAWNIERTNRLEAELANTEGIDPLLSETNAKTLDRIWACRARAERTFHKCHKEIRALKSPTRPQAKPAPTQIQRNEPKFVTHPSQSYVSPAAKIGRNEPCPCKSGRKFKVCCLRNEANSAAWIATDTTQEICLQG